MAVPARSPPRARKSKSFKRPKQPRSPSTSSTRCSYTTPRDLTHDPALADNLVGLVIYGSHGGPPVSMDLFALATLPTAADEPGEPPSINFYELRDNLPRQRALAAGCRADRIRETSELRPAPRRENPG